jgi:hypothetical protein
MSGFILLLFAATMAGLPDGAATADNYVPEPGGLTRDTTAAGIAAWKATNQRAWEAMRRAEQDGADTLELVGRWPFGGALRVRPSWNVASDSIVYMTDGSGIRVLDVSNPSRPQMIGQANCRGILDGQMENGTGFVSRDTFLYVAYMRTRGLQIFSVADPTRPYELGDLPLSGDPTGVALKDSFIIVVGWDSVLRVINVANPHNPREVASLLLPDYGLGVDIKGNYAFVGCAHAGLVSVDISNPLNPLQRGQVAGFTGIWVVCDTTRQLAYVAGGAGGLHIINIADPSSLSRISTLATTPTIDVFKADTFLYLTGSTAYQSNFYVVSIADSAHPRLVGQSLTDGWSFSACALSPFSYAYTCDGWEGLHVISLANPASPQVDTAMLGAWGSQDLAVQDSLVFLANYWAGLKVISLASPQEPVEVGALDSANMTPYIGAIAVRDSFAFTMWQDGPGNQYFRSLDITDPRNPVPSGTSLTLWEAKAIILRDTFAFVAEDYKFEVYNIAHPRQPVRIGSCDLTTSAGSMCLRDSLAFIAPNLHIVNVSDPAHPVLLSTSNSNSAGVVVKDTFAYCRAVTSLEVWSVADPTGPRLLTTVPALAWGGAIDIQGSVVYSGYYSGLEAFDITNPVAPARFAASATPDVVGRIKHDSVYVYAACVEGGLCIFRRCTTGLAESSGATVSSALRISPNPCAGLVDVQLVVGVTPVSFVVRDVLGNRVMTSRQPQSRPGSSTRLDLRSLPDGCYFVSSEGLMAERPLKLIVSKRR